MSRPRRTLSLDEKITQAQNEVDAYKEKYNAAVERLNALISEKETAQKENILAAINGSTKSYDEIIAFLSGGEDQITQ